MNAYVMRIVNAIPSWSNKLQGDRGFRYKKELRSAHNFVTDHSGNHWTYGKYHSDGAGARKRLEDLGFKDVLSTNYADRDVKERLVEEFRAWARSVKVLNLNAKLDRYLNGELRVKFRLFIPPEP